MVGPLGQASLECAIGNQWIACTTARDALPLRTWIHVAGVYRADSGLTVFLNGEPAAAQAVKGAITFAPQAGYVLGMVARPDKPSDIHRTHGTLPAYFGLDGILDEVKVYDSALPAERIKAGFAAVTPGAPDIAPRKLPAVDFKPGRFGAFSTKLKYHPGWDNLWPVDQDPDIVVCFKESPVRLVFWRGTRYSPAWVSENGNWMTDQSVETWATGDRDREGCFEHMQDRHCRFSHVRIIENTPARVVVHWRYAPVSAYDNTWNVDPKTGWELWIDEYYYIYPDASAVRKVSWKKGTLGDTFQLQETLALLHPGQAVSDLLEKDYVVVADYSGQTGGSSYVENPGLPPYGPFRWEATKPFTVQQYQFKSKNKPFIFFEPGNKMSLRFENLAAYGRASGCNHFPVGQARCDGRTTLTSDKPSHCSSFPISEPVIHEAEDREFWYALYGMNSMAVKDVIEFGKILGLSSRPCPEGRRPPFRGLRPQRALLSARGCGREAPRLRSPPEGRRFFAGRPSCSPRPGLERREAARHAERKGLSGRPRGPAPAARRRHPRHLPAGRVQVPSHGPDRSRLSGGRARAFIPAGGRRVSAGDGSAVQARPTTDSTSSMVRGFFLPRTRWPSAVMTASSSLRNPPKVLVGLDLVVVDVFRALWPSARHWSISSGMK